MKRSTMYLGVGLLLSAVAGLAACGGSKSSSSEAMATAAVNEMAAAAETMSYDTAYAEEAYEEVYAESAAPPAEGAGLSDSTSISPPSQTGRKLIRNVGMTVETDSFDQLVKSLTDKIGELGGYVEQSEISGNSLNRQNEPSPRYASLTVRIPLDKVDGFVTAVESNGNVTNKSESTQDITLQYSDLESRKRSLTVEQDRIWALLEKADTLESVIVLEERLSEIRYELESMESQLRLYDNQVDYSTVYLTINEIRDPAAFTPTGEEGPMQQIKSGFYKNLKSISHGLSGLFIWLAASSPFWIPVAAAAAVVLYVIRRRKKKERQILMSAASGEKEESGGPH